MVPVMALPTNRISFTAFTAQGAPVSSAPGPNYVNYVTDDNVRVVKDLLGVGIASIWISPNSYPLTPNLKGTANGIFDITINLNTGDGWAVWSATWTFTGGTYQGWLMAELVGPPGNQLPTAYAYNNLHGTFYGTGTFEGQTLILQGAKPVGQPFSFTGVIVTL